MDADVKLSKKSEHLNAISTSDSDLSDDVFDEPEVQEFKNALLKEGLDIDEIKLSQMEEEFKIELDKPSLSLSKMKRYEPMELKKRQFKTPDEEINELLAESVKGNTEVLKYTKQG